MNVKEQQHSEQKCSICSCILISKDSDDLDRPSKTKSSTCLECERKALSAEGSLQADPDSLRPYKCDTCGKRFRQKYNLVVHFRIHTGEKDFACTICGRAFAYKSALTVHYRVHTGEKKYECPICKRKFSHKCTLTCHVKTHDDETPDNRKGFYPCDKCGQMFYSKSPLLLHKRVHARGLKDCAVFTKLVLDQTRSKEPCYVCKVCGKKFSGKRDIRGHIKIHTQEKNHACEYCGKKFREKKHLQIHITIHTGNRRFMCEECGKRFSQNSHLRVHMRSHTGEKFYCAECGKGFHNKSHLVDHLKRHAKANEEQNSVSITKGKKFNHIVGKANSAKVQVNDNAFSMHKDNREFDTLDKLKSEDLECNLCKEKFVDEDLLLEHCKLHEEHGLINAHSQNDYDKSEIPDSVGYSSPSKNTISDGKCIIKTEHIEGEMPETGEGIAPEEYVWVKEENQGAVKQEESNFIS